jgi:hypothetical protein
MKHSFSTKDIELLGYIDAREENHIGDKPYQVYSASAMAGIKKIEAKFIYLKSHCSKNDATELAREMRRISDIIVIVPKSISLKKETLQDMFGLGTSVFIYEDLIWDKLSSLFSEYLETISSSIVPADCYIPPRQEGADPRERLDDEILNYITGKKDIAGRIMVVCASAGVGKTTLARQLTVRLAQAVQKNRVVPVYVEATHWGKLRIESVDELWEVIDNSLRNFSSNLRMSESLFEHALRNGSLAFIFDGFDELCGHRVSQLKPRDVLDKLATIGRDSSAKILLTTRTLYWDAEINDPPENCHILELAPFNTQQAKGYFDKYFSKDRRLWDQAVSLYSQLIESNKPPTLGGPRLQFVNLPLCVGMIAECVRLGGTTSIKAQAGKGLIRDVLLQICEREQARKNLITDAETQLAAFEEVAVDQSDVVAPEFDLEILSIAGFHENDLIRIIDHPLLNTDNQKLYYFKYDFLPQYLRAFCLSKTIAAHDLGLKNNILRMMSSEANGKGHMLEHLRDLMDTNALDDIKQCYNKMPRASGEANSFLFHLARSMVNQSPDYKTQRDRTIGLLSLFQDEFNSNWEIYNLFVVGNIDGLDLRGLTFNKCDFLDTTFSRCMADNTTVFRKCRFSGELDFLSCDKKLWGQVRLIDPILFPPTNLIWQEMLEESFGSKEDLIQDALRLALNKFWYHGRLKRTIRKENWRKGTLGHSIYCDPILKAMLKHNLVEEVHISSVQEGGYFFDSDSIADLQRFMDNRHLTGKIREIYDYLCRTK